jgi:hypothetical protein
MILRWIDIEENGLRHRNERSAAQPLQQAGNHDLRQRLRKAAECRGNRESQQREQEYTPAANLPGEPATQRRHDGRGDDV